MRIGKAQVVKRYIHLQAWNLTGDMHTKEPGAKPWIAEMYGYVFGAAKAGVWHNPVDYFHWMYPGFFTYGVPLTCTKEILNNSNLRKHQTQAGDPEPEPLVLSSRIKAQELTPSDYSERKSDLQHA